MCDLCDGCYDLDSTFRRSCTASSRELTYALAPNRWAAIGKASSPLRVYSPNVSLTAATSAAGTVLLACDTGPASGEPAT